MERAKNRLGLIFFPAFDWSISPFHPEREERLLYTRDQVVEEGLLDIDGINEYNPIMADNDFIKQVHVCVPDINTRITKSHKISAGGAIKAGKSVMEGEVDKAFALVRPPGHHARRIVHGARGFCTINIEAIMIEYLRNEYGVQKIAVVDTDCHHGDGTQDIYWNDPNVLFISFHQDGRTLYPGSGFIKEKGGPAARGYNLNLPFPPGTSDEGLFHALDNLVLPVLDEFDPDIIINSAGQDNHYSDPLTNMNISAQGYAELNNRLDPDLAVLEGGYAIEKALPYVNTGIILAMAGLDYSRVEEPDYNPHKLKENSSTRKTIRDICNKVKSIWDNREIYSVKNKTTERSVFYDTEGIMEEQKEEFYNCVSCPEIGRAHV